MREGSNDSVVTPSTAPLSHTLSSCSRTFSLKRENIRGSAVAQQLDAEIIIKHRRVKIQYLSKISGFSPLKSLSENCPKNDEISQNMMVVDPLVSP